MHSRKLKDASCIIMVGAGRHGYPLRCRYISSGPCERYRHSTPEGVVICAPMGACLRHMGRTGVSKLHDGLHFFLARDPGLPLVC